MQKRKQEVLALPPPSENNQPVVSVVATATSPSDAAAQTPKRYPSGLERMEVVLNLVCPC